MAFYLFIYLFACENEAVYCRVACFQQGVEYFTGHFPGFPDEINHPPPSPICSVQPGSFGGKPLAEITSKHSLFLMTPTDDYSRPTGNKQARLSFRFPSARKRPPRQKKKRWQKKSRICVARSGFFFCCLSRRQLGWFPSPARINGFHWKGLFHVDCSVCVRPERTMNLPSWVGAAVPRRDNLVNRDTLLKHSVFLDQGQVDRRFSCRRKAAAESRPPQVFSAFQRTNVGLFMVNVCCCFFIPNVIGCTQQMQKGIKNTCFDQLQPRSWQVWHCGMGGGSMFRPDYLF